MFKKIHASYFTAGIGFALTVFFLSPLDLYLNNFTDFNISLFNVLIPLLIVSLAFLAVLLALTFVLKGRGLDIFTDILCGLTLACYVQSLFFNRFDIQTGIINFANVVNFILWISLFALPVILRIVMKKKEISTNKFVLYLPVVILGMLFAGIFAAISNYDEDSVSSTNFFSYNDTFELSNDENICVFIMDRLDVKYMNEVLESNPNLRDLLDGFTFYENNISTHANTFPAVAQMLTGAQHSHTEKWTDYWVRAWAGNNFIDSLREFGYVTTLLLDKPTTYGNISQIADRSDNIVQLSASELKINYFEIGKTTLSISFGRLLPNYFKRFFSSQHGIDFSVNNFYLLPDDSTKAIAYPSVTHKSDQVFYERLKEIGLSAKNQTKTFTLSHLNCSHSFSTGHLPERTLYAFELLGEYFAQLKRLEIYDSSTIIIIADHGRVPVEIEQGGESRLEDAITASLLIKPKDSRGQLLINSTAQLSHTNFAASILDIAGLDYDGLSYFDIINGELPQERTFNLNRWFGLGNVRHIGEYKINGDANNFTNWVFKEENQ